LKSTSTLLFSIKASWTIFATQRIRPVIFTPEQQLPGLKLGVILWIYHSVGRVLLALQLAIGGRDAGALTVLSIPWN